MDWANGTILFDEEIIIDDTVMLSGYCTLTPSAVSYLLPPGASPSKLASMFLIRIMDIRHQEESKRNKSHYHDHLRDVMKNVMVSLHLSL